METLGVVLLFISSVFIGIGAGTLFRSNKIIAVFVFIGLISILTSWGMYGEINKGKPASLSNLTLTTGEKYEVVAMYEEYIVVKSLTNEKQERLRFIGPLINSGALSVGDMYIKTAESSLEKFLRH